VYCYTCIVGEIANEEGDGWSCLRCGEVIRNVMRWEERVGETLQAQEEKNVGSGGSEGTEKSSEGNVTPDVESIEDTSEEAAQEEAEESEEENLFSQR
jgi:peroxin-2